MIKTLHDLAHPTTTPTSCPLSAAPPASLLLAQNSSHVPASRNFCICSSFLLRCLPDSLASSTCRLTCNPGKPSPTNLFKTATPSSPFLAFLFFLFFFGTSLLNICNSLLYLLMYSLSPWLERKHQERWEFLFSSLLYPRAYSNAQHKTDT